MKQFFQEIWLSFQPKHYYRFVAAGQLSNRLVFLMFLVLTYSLITGAIIFSRIQSNADFIFDQAARIIGAMPKETAFIFQDQKLTIKNLPQPYQEKIVGFKGQIGTLLIDTQNLQPKLDDFGLILSQSGVIIQTTSGAELFAWQNLPNQTISQTQLLNLTAGGWRVGLWLLASILFIILVISLFIFWLIYIWLWSWLLKWPTKKLGLTLPYSEMTIVITHWCVVPMLLQIILRFLPGNLGMPFLPTAVGLLFWLAVVKAWPKSNSLLTESV